MPSRLADPPIPRQNRPRWRDDANLEKLLADMLRRQARAVIGDRCDVWREQVGALQSDVDRRVSAEMAEVLTPIIRAFEAGKFRFRRTGPREPHGPNLWEVIGT